jgi:hypothetical protein
MSTTVATIYERALRKIGGITGTVASPGTTSVILSQLIGTTGDNTAYAGDRLWFLASASGSRERLITSWADSTGTATIPTMTAAASGAHFILVPREDYTLGETDEAFRKALRDTWRTYRMVIPVAPLLRYQALNALDWLQGAGRVDAVFRNDSPLMLHNEDFALWQNGPSAAPDGYTLEGTGATVTRVSGGIRSLYAARVTVGSGTARLVQAIPATLSQWITRRTFPVFYPLRVATWATASASSSVRCFIRYTQSGVSTYLYSDYVTADGYPHFPDGSLTPDGAQDDYEWGIEVTSGYADVSWAGLMQNTIPFTQAYQIKDQGSQFYSEYQVNDVVRNIGGQPMVEFQSYPATWGQAIVYSRRPFPALDPATDGYAVTVEDQYAEIIEAGTLVYLLQAQKPNQDRARLDRVLAEMTSIWNRRNTNQLDLPVARPPAQMVVGGI